MRSATSSAVNPALRPRNVLGRYVPGTVFSPAQITAEKRQRAKEWRAFRARFLFSQNDLAHALGCSARTVSSVEAGQSIPLPRIQRAFRELRQRQEREMA